ncbi:Crp/Fnr family transcriptional regulator [Flammeovirga agarivorans]|uniref:Crp/Fnr family transcriptional regulator n=1 Tax=Flammeovirga agarivorans TaxID=2726742 RepID=A0A7X8SP43_9BACT|nr:Crp/Fnr family transcriptional regulator [Flammeovirga agarivorans]NLR93808.1 Crp/Fnr family transcriptional regulator [Flammeovirga agarivorans]
MQEIKVKKGTILQHSGEINSKIYKVKNGLLRSYSIDKNGHENIFMFAPEGWIIADSCAPTSPSVLFIDALEDSTIIVLPKELEKEKDNIEPLAKRMKVLQERIIMLISTNAIERYEHFIETYPNIVQRVSQKMIASYLGVTPETLSAAKAKRSKKE